MATKKTPTKKQAPTSKAKAPVKPAAKTPEKKPAKKPAKKLPGKTNVIASSEDYKPSIYLDDGQIPKELKGAKVGDTVNLMVTGKVIRKSESQDTGGISNSLAIEMGSIKSPGKATGKKGW